MLLTGLRHVHRMSAGVSMDSEVLAHTAQAMKDREFLILAEGCHPRDAAADAVGQRHGGDRCTGPITD